MAMQLAAGFNVPGSPVTATVSGAQITLTALAAGAIGDYPVTISNGDITVSAQTPTLTGGQDLVAGAGSFYSYQVGSYAPNGNILSHKDSVMGTWNFAYDTLNRLATAGASAPSPFANLNGCWNYDAFGNRTLEAFSAAAPASCGQGANAQYTVTTAGGLTSSSGPGRPAGGEAVDGDAESTGKCPAVKSRALPPFRESPRRPAEGWGTHF